ncbi:MAG TPA: hypothetical protein VGA87_03230, partial [Pyrinomonadaceae bacterium]
GFQPWPNAHTQFRGQRLVVHQVSLPDVSFDSFPERAGVAVGEIRQVRGDALEVECGSGTRLLLSEVQLEGKRRMSARDFVNGMRVHAGERLGNESEGEGGRGKGER